MVCPKCGNNYCTIKSKTKVTGKDYSVARGLLGELLFGTAGFGLGFTNNREVDVQAFWVCSKCGHEFKA